MKEKNAKPSPVYSRAKTWQIALTTMTGIGQMVFYVLMTSAFGWTIPTKHHSRQQKTF